MNEAWYIPTLDGYPDVLAVIRALQDGIPFILGDTLVGLYLTGSLTYGGFDPTSSDIDFLALCRRRPSADQIAALSDLHRDIARRTPRWAERIEGSYIWESMLASLEPPDEPRPYINCGAMWAPEPLYGQEWVMNLFVLHERGVALFGPPAADVFPRVSMQQLRDASLRSLHEAWEPLLADDSRLDDPHYQAYLTLTLCRILQTQKVDGIASKRDAAQWVMDRCSDAVRRTVERAEQWEVGQQLDMKDEVLDLLRFTLAETGSKAAGQFHVKGWRAMNKINLAEKFALFSEHWSPKIIGELNNFAVKVVKVQGEFVWHHHDVEDELFFVLRGRLLMHVRDLTGEQRDIWVEPGELIIIPHGVEHCPAAEEETQLVLLEPATTVNTGNVVSERTVPYVEQL